MHPRTRNPIVFRCATAIFWAAAAYHAAALVVPSFARIAYPAEYPSWRHVAFTTVNVVFGWLFIVRPPWLIWLFVALTLQVFAGHGVAAWRSWRYDRHVDAISVACLVAVALGVVALAHDRRKKARI
jgi:hypothetical protein